jgi:mevalonate kinase
VLELYCKWTDTVMTVGASGMARSTAKTVKTSFRLTAEARRLLEAFAEAKGLNLTSALELVIRDAAKREGIK